ncbi:tyrosine--tRNA ligase, cytoplasmic [Pelomyxa schiedti]|nr:tyrosine--tRNA ligase, cytoplasmic [Pelomyxa schiedti]
MTDTSATTATATATATTTAAASTSTTVVSTPSLSVDEKVALITRNLQEVIGTEQVRAIVQEGRPLKIYWGTAPTGKPHIGYFVPTTKIADFLKAGCEVTILFADLHAFLDNLKTSWDLLTFRTQYYEIVIKGLLESVGAPIERLKFVRGTDFQLSRDYTLDMYKLASKSTLHDAKKAGAEVVKQVDNPLMSGLMYPLLQALDEQYLGVDAQFGGVDQRKIFMFAEENLPVIGYKKRIHLMNAMVPGFSAARPVVTSTPAPESTAATTTTPAATAPTSTTPATPSTASAASTSAASALTYEKMSASTTDSKIDLLDDPATVMKKVSKAFCEPGNIRENALLVFCRLVLFPLLDGKPLVIPRADKYGGPISLTDYAELETAFGAQKLFPPDLKLGVHTYINHFLAPIRAKFTTPELQQLVAKAYPNDPVPVLTSTPETHGAAVAKPKATPKGKPAAKPAEKPMDISRANLLVGLIEKCEKHPGADSLFVETVDFGPHGKATVVSGLANFMKPEDLTGKRAVFLKNLKPSKLRGVMSEAMILAASNPEHTQVEVVFPPADTPIGERVTVAGFPGEPDDVLKVWDKIQPDLSTSTTLSATYKGVPLATSRGECKVRSLVGANVK